MSQQHASDAEKALVEALDQQSPELLELAGHVAFVPRIEQRLLRGIRLNFFPRLDVSYEHRLWFSDLVFTRNTSNFIFTAGMTNLLATRARQHLEPTKLEQLWQYCQQLTRHWNPIDRLERDLFYYAVTENSTNIEKVFRDLLRLIAIFSEDPQANRPKLLEISRRIKYSTALLNENELDTETSYAENAKHLINFAANSLHDPGSWSDMVAPQPLPEWLASAVPAREKSRLAVELRHEPGQSRNVLYFSKPEAGNDKFIEFDTPPPARLFIKADGLDDPWALVSEGSKIELKLSATRIELTTRHGKHYQLEIKTGGSEGDIKTDEESAAQKYHLAHTKFDESMAIAMKEWLKVQDIEVELVEERPFQSPTETRDETVKVMRLWTSSMQKLWQEMLASDASPSAGSLLLRVEDVEPPSGYNSPSQMLDVRNWQNDSEQRLARTVAAKIADWAEGAPGPESAAETDEFEAERKRLFKEIENPETKPQRRLAIGDRLDEVGDTREGVGVIEIELPATTPETSPEQFQIDKLLDELESPKTEPRRRLEIGDEFDQMVDGDPRAGTGLDERGLPDIDWVLIPAGEFIFGEDDEETTHYVDAFEIARYPVTNRQYQCFIDDSGYEDSQWWQGLEKPDMEPSRWPQGNRPRTDVDWYEAAAFCRWLSARCDQTITLPNENQWERAARGSGGLKYPWGDDYRVGHANVDETGGNQDKMQRTANLEQTTAVGLYPQGNSIEEVADLSGNVWEWCRNPNGDRDSEAVGRDQAPALRGGSWDLNPDYARAAFRHGFIPVRRGSLFGFRLVCSPP